MTAHSYSLQDKRLSSRYPVKDSSAAVLMTPGNIVSYCILDVSKSGLSFCYNGNAKKSKILKNAVVTFLAEESESVDISVQIVSDTKLKEDSLWLATQEDKSNIPYLRRCGVKFNSLSPGQEDVINGYIQSLLTN
jgi:hypothetical protein